MKNLTVVVGVLVVGIVLSFGMSVYTAVKQHQAESQPAPAGIPTPAIPAQ